MSNHDDWTLTDRLHAPTGKGDPFAAAVRATRMPMLITDPRLPDNPIVFVNDAFLYLTGYGRDEVMGRNCRFLQGPDTGHESIDAIRRAIEAEDDLAIEILNYKKGGEAFWNALYLSPVKDEAGELLFFFASQFDVTARKSIEIALREEKARIEDAVSARTQQLQQALDEQTELVHEIDHRVKNNLQTILALIRLELNEPPDCPRDVSLHALRRRVEALAHVYRRSYRSGRRTGFDVARFLAEIAADSSQFGVPLQIETDEAPVQIIYAVSVALIAAEFLNIAAQYGETHKCDSLYLSLKRITEDLYRCCLIGGPEAPPVAEAVSSSSRAFIEIFAPQLNARIDWNGEMLQQNCICIDIPIDQKELAR